MGLPLACTRPEKLPVALGERGDGIDVRRGRTGQDVLEIDHEEGLVVAVVQLGQHDGAIEFHAGLGPGERSAGNAGRIVLKELALKTVFRS